MTTSELPRRAPTTTRRHPTRWSRFVSLYASSVGRKYVMAWSGVAIVGFVIAHLIGTLKLFLGPDSTNAYGEALRHLGGELVPRTHLLWLLRIGLIAAFTVHLHAAFSLDRRNRRARATTPIDRDLVAASYASRTVLWSGITIGLFLVFHLADLTWGWVNPDFERGDAYGNQIESFQNPAIVAVYLVGVGAMTVHLFHGLWSLTRSLGVGVDLFGAGGERRVAGLAASVIGAGYASMPIAVQLGVLGPAA